jgi:hypothetical protein
MPFNTTPTYNITTVRKVTATRVWDQTYVNSTGRTMWVTIAFQYTVTVLNGSAGFLVLTTPLNAWIAQGGSFNTTVLNQLTAGSVTFPVRPGDTYCVQTTQANGTLTLDEWVEAF